MWESETRVLGPSCVAPHSSSLSYSPPCRDRCRPLGLGGSCPASGPKAVWGRVLPLPWVVDVLAVLVGHLLRLVRAMPQAVLGIYDL